MSAFVLPPPRFTDPTVFGRVAVLMGGTSSEREVSLDSGRNVLAALRAHGVDAHPVDGIPALAEALLAKKFDRVFNVLHGQRGGGEDGVVQGLMDALAVPYTGSGVLGSATETVVRRVPSVKCTSSTALQPVFWKSEMRIASRLGSVDCARMLSASFNAGP